jgi:hypothetical protein
MLIVLSRTTKVLDQRGHEHDAVPTQRWAVAFPCQLVQNFSQTASLVPNMSAMSWARPWRHALCPKSSRSTTSQMACQAVMWASWMRGVLSDGTHRI